jgi:hypothetical protein
VTVASVPIVPGLGERDVVVDVTIKSDTRGADKAAKSLGDVDRAAGKTGHSLFKMSEDAKLVDAEMKKTTAHIEELERTMLRTGDRSLQKQIASERRWLQSLSKVIAPDFIKKDASQGINQVIMQLPRQMSGAGILGGLVALAALGPLLGGAVAGLVSGAIGTGGIAGGIAMAASNPKVKSAAGQFGDMIAGEFSKGGDAFVTPILQSLTTLNVAFQKMDLPGTFARMAPHMQTIAEGFGSFGKNLMPGLRTAFDRMGPFAEAAREGFSEMGSALSKFLDLITESPGAVMALDATFKAINATIVFLGQNLNYLADAFAGGLIVGEKVTGFMEDIPLIGGLWGMMNDQINDTMHGMADAADETRLFGQDATYTASQLSVMGESIADVNTQLRTLADQISGMLNDQLSVDKANLAVEQGWADLTEKIRENGTALGTGTQAARDNEAAILDQISKLADQRDAIIRVTGKTGEASAAYDAQIQKLINLGIEAGISTEKMEALAGDYRVRVAFEADMSRWLNQFGYLLPGYGSDVTSFASGGTTPANEVFRVGENGPEYMFSSRPQFVATAAMMAGASGGGWGGGRVETDVRVSGDADSAVAAMIMKMIRNGQITIASRAVVG